MQGKQFACYVYGSASSSCSESRDIDLVVISRDEKAVSLDSFETIIGSRRMICNLYYVPDPVYLDDLHSLAYGGYYAHKFSLSFRLLCSSGMNADSPFLFWKSQREYFAGKLKKDIGPGQLMRLAHYQILYYRPTFIRALVKFVNQTERMARLEEYLEKNVCDHPFVPTATSELSQLPGTGDFEKSLYRFWMEYDRQKNPSSQWGSRTFDKISLSCAKPDMLILQDYFIFSENYDTELFGHTPA